MMWHDYGFRTKLEVVEDSRDPKCLSTNFKLLQSVCSPLQHRPGRVWLAIYQGCMHSHAAYVPVLQMRRSVRCIREADRVRHAAVFLTNVTGLLLCAKPRQQSLPGCSCA